MSDSLEEGVTVPRDALTRRPRPELWHHLVALAFPLVCLWAAGRVGGRDGLGHALVTLGIAYTFVVFTVWLELPRPKATVSNTMLGVALEPVRNVAVPIALFGVTTVVAAYVGAAVGDRPSDYEATASVIGWSFGGAALVVLLVAVPYVYWRARSLTGKQLRRARRALARPIANPFKPSTVSVDLNALAARPVGEYALWFATSKGGRNLMWCALLAVGAGSWIVSKASVI